MLHRAFYFEIASPFADDWRAERQAYDAFEYDWFELLVEYPYRLSDLKPDELNTLKSLLAGKTLSFHGATLNLSLVALNEAVVTETQAVLAAQLADAASLGCRLFTFHAGEHPYFYERVGEPLHVALTRNLQPLLASAAHHGCRLCIENLKNKNTYPLAATQLDALFSVCPELGFALDVRHACVTGQNPVTLAKDFASQLASVQYRADCGLDAADIAALIDTLDANGFDGPFIVEDASLNRLDKTTRDMLAAAQQQLSGLVNY